MKSLAFVLSYLSAGLRGRNLRVLLILLGIFVVLVATYSTLFHVLMEREGQFHSWPTAVYWTLVTMTTLGFGDITFETDAGRMFSVVVLLSGSVFLLVLLPFAFIQFVFTPWMARREAARAPRELPADTEGHLILTALGPIEEAIVRRADLAGVPYVVMAPELDDALRFHDLGYRVLLGSPDDPAAFRAARVERAALVAATGTDTRNANITFTAREIAPNTRVVTTVSNPASADILELAGADEVLRLAEMLGHSMAERVLARDGSSHVVGGIAGLCIAEARALSTELVGRTLGELNLRASTGVTVLGLWQRGRFQMGGRSTRIESGAVLIIAAEPQALETFDRRFATGSEGTDAVVIIGGGRVGRAAGTAFGQRDIPYRIVEQRSERIRNPENYVEGDAADLAVLEAAGIRSASAVLITTHDDDMNIYLSLYCRRLRPDLRILSRSNLERNVTTLYRAGADDVFSYASTGAAAIWNHLRSGDILLLAEGLNVFRRPVPAGLVGRTLATSGIRERTACNVVAIERADRVDGNPPGDTTLEPGDRLILIGDEAGELRFATLGGGGRRRGRAATRNGRP